jgi:hypothetical protein
LAVGVYAGFTIGQAMRPESERLQLGEFGDGVPDATLTSYSIAVSKGLKQKDFWAGSIDIVQTKKEIGVFTSRSTLNPTGCEENCMTIKGKTSFMLPGISITKTKAILYGDELRKDVTVYQGGASVGSIGGGAPVGIAVEGFSSTDPNTGKKNNKIIGGGVSIGFSLGLDPYIASYYSSAKPIGWPTRWIFRKPWMRGR